MEKIDCIVVDDDEVSLRLLENLIEKTPVLNHKNSFQDSKTALEYLTVNKVDLIFLDIEMPDLGGFELINLLNYSPKVIVTTSKKQYAADAFEYEVSDFLIKPLTDYPRFLKSVNSVRAALEKSNQRKGDNVFVKSDSLLHNIVIDNILYVEAFGDYVKIYTHQKVLMVLSTLKSFEEKVAAKHFVRVHRSYIVNINKIDNIDPANLQIGSKIIPVSNNYREDLLTKIHLL